MLKRRRQLIQNIEDNRKRVNSKETVTSKEQVESQPSNLFSSVSRSQIQTSKLYSLERQTCSQVMNNLNQNEYYIQNKQRQSAHFKRQKIDPCGILQTKMDRMELGNNKLSSRFLNTQKHVSGVNCKKNQGLYRELSKSHDSISGHSDNLDQKDELAQGDDKEKCDLRDDLNEKSGKINKQNLQIPLNSQIQTHQESPAKNEKDYELKIKPWYLILEEIEREKKMKYEQEQNEKGERESRCQQNLDKDTIRSHVKVVSLAYNYLKNFEKNTEETLYLEKSSLQCINIPQLSHSMTYLLQVFSQLDFQDQHLVRSLSIMILVLNCFESTVNSSEQSNFDLRLFSQVQIQMWMQVFVNQVNTQHGHEDQVDGNQEPNHVQPNPILLLIQDFTDQFLEHLSRQIQSAQIKNNQMAFLRFIEPFRSISPSNRISVFFQTFLQLLQQVPVSYALSSQAGSLCRDGVIQSSDQQYKINNSTSMLSDIFAQTTAQALQYLLLRSGLSRATQEPSEKPTTSKESKISSSPDEDILCQEALFAIELIACDIVEALGGAAVRSRGSGALDESVNKPSEYQIPFTFAVSSTGLESLGGGLLEYPVLQLVVKYFVVALGQQLMRPAEMGARDDHGQEFTNDGQSNVGRQVKVKQLSQIVEILKPVVIQMQRVVTVCSTSASNQDFQCFCLEDISIENSCQIKQKDHFDQCQYCARLIHIKCNQCGNIGFDQSLNQICVSCLFSFSQQKDSNEKRKSTSNLRASNIRSDSKRNWLAQKTFRIQDEFYSKFQQSKYGDFTPAHVCLALFEIEFSQLDSNKSTQFMQDEYSTDFNQKICQILKNQSSNSRRKHSNSQSRPRFVSLKLNQQLLPLTSAFFASHVLIDTLAYFKKVLLICLISSKAATLRQKLLVLLRSWISENTTEMLLDSDIQNLIQTRLADVSSSVREVALDIVCRNLLNIKEIGNQDQFEFDNIQKQDKIQKIDCQKSQINSISHYIQMVLNRANFETSLVVRRKITQILTLALNSDLYDKSSDCQIDSSDYQPSNSIKQTIIRTMFLKWIDATHSVKQQMIQSIQQLIKQTKDKNKFNILFDIIKVLTENHGFLNRRDQIFMSNCSFVDTVEKISDIFRQVLAGGKSVKQSSKDRNQDQTDYAESKKQSKKSDIKQTNDSQLSASCNSIVCQAIDLLYEAMNNRLDSGQSTFVFQVNTSLIMILIMAKLDQRAVQDFFKVLLDVQADIEGQLQGNIYYKQQIDLLMLDIFHTSFYKKETRSKDLDEEDISSLNDWLSPSTFKSLHTLCLKTITGFLLQNQSNGNGAQHQHLQLTNAVSSLRSPIRLLYTLCSQACDLTPLLQILMKCCQVVQMNSSLIQTEISKKDTSLLQQPVEAQSKHNSKVTNEFLIAAVLACVIVSETFDVISKIKTSSGKDIISELQSSITLQIQLATTYSEKTFLQGDSVQILVECIGLIYSADDSGLWLQQTDKNQTIFENIWQIMESKRSNLSNHSKARIIQTLSDLLNKVQKRSLSIGPGDEDHYEKVKQLAKHLVPFLQFMTSPSGPLRTQTSLLFHRLNLSGSLTTTRIPLPSPLTPQFSTPTILQTYLQLLCDPCPILHSTAVQHLQTFSRTRLTLLLQALLAPRNILERLFGWCELTQIVSEESRSEERTPGAIGCFYTSAFARKEIVAHRGATVIVELDESVLDCVVLGILGREDEKSRDAVIEKWTCYPQDCEFVQSESEKDFDLKEVYHELRKCRFYLELLFSLLKPVITQQTPKSSKMNSKQSTLSSRVIQAIENFMQTRDLQTYKNLKNISLDVPSISKSFSLDQQAVKIIVDAVLVVAFKICLTQIQSQSKLRQKYVTDPEATKSSHNQKEDPHDLNDSKQINSYTRASLKSKTQLDGIFSAFDDYSPNQDPKIQCQYLEIFLQDLKLHLKDIIQQKGDQLKRKFQQKIDKNKLIGVNYKDPQRRKGKKSSGKRSQGSVYS